MSDDTLDYGIALDGADNDSNGKAVITDYVDSIAKALLAELKANMPTMLAERRAFFASFEDRLYQRWGRALDLFDTCRVVALEAGEEFHRRGSGRGGKADIVYRVLVRLHARACLTASEVGSMLRTGHAEAALARWRTMYEIAVISYLVKEHGRDLAERYYLHGAVESLKGAERYQQHCVRLGYRPFSEDEMRKMRAQSEALCTRFGDSYRHDYGWAAHALGVKKPAFSNLEQAVKLEYVRPYYMWASRKVHATSKGIALVEDDTHGHVMLAGPSNGGLCDPGQMTVISLLQCTGCLLGLDWDVKTLATFRALYYLVGETERAFIEAHHELKKASQAVRDRRQTISGHRRRRLRRERYGIRAMQLWRRNDSR